MTAFEPPDFSFIGLQFNKDIFENELTEGVTAIIPDPFPITELDTNNIQALNLGVPVTLYTNFDNVLQLGGQFVTSLSIQAATQISFAVDTLYHLATDGFRSMFVDFPTSLDLIRQVWSADTTNAVSTITMEISPSTSNPTLQNRGLFDLLCGSFQVGLGSVGARIQTLFEISNVIVTNFYADVSNPTVTTAEISVSNLSSSLTPNQGSVFINSALLQAPNNIYSVNLSAPQYLYEANLSSIQMGAFSPSIQLLSTSLTTPNELLSKTLSDPQDLFQTTTGVINLGLASSNVSIQSTNLTSPNTIVSVSPGSQQNLFTTNTGDIVLAGSSTGVRINSTVRTNIIVATTPASSAVNLYNNFTSGSSGSVALGNNFLPSITTRSIALSTHANTFNLRSNTTANQRIQQTFQFTNSTQQQFYVDNGNSGIITSEVNVTAGVTPTVDRSGTYQILSGTLDLGTGGSSTTVNGSLSTDTIKAITPASSVVNLYTNFSSLSTSTVAFGNAFLASYTARSKIRITRFDTHEIRSNTTVSQKIEQTFPSTTTQRESFYIDNGNSGVETCRISVSQGTTPLVDNTGILTLTAGTASLTTDVTNLCNTGASSVVNCNAQLIPKYVYNATTGVSNAAAIGYTTYGVASAAGALTSGVTVLRSTVTIGVDGVYMICTNQAISMTTGGAIQRIASFCDIYNGAGVFQVAVGVGTVPSITGLVTRIYHMPWTTVYVVQGATVALPFTFRFRLEPVFSPTIASTNLNFNFGFTRLA